MTRNHYCCFGCKQTITIILAPKECLITENYYVLVWHTFVDLDLSRRGLAEEVVNIFRDMCCTEIVTFEGEKYVLPEFDDVFTEDESRRWFGNYIQSDAKKLWPKNFSKIIPRLEILDLAAKLINPMPFKAIGYVC